MSRIRITLGQVVVIAGLNSSRTARLLAAALPFDSEARRWGEEVYFPIPLDTDEENPQEEVPKGTVAYWPPGKALCLFFGQRPYSPVNVVGTIDGDASVLRPVAEGQAVRVEPA